MSDSQEIQEEEIIIESKPKYEKESIQLLVVSNNKHDYIRLFKDLKISELPVHVDQASWDDLTLSAYSSTKDITHGLVVEVAQKTREKPLQNSMQWKRRTIRPDFLLIRNVCRGVYPHDFRNILFGFMFANIPSVNTLDSIYMALERTNVHAALKKIQKKLGKTKFPLIEQYYHSGGRDINFPPEPYPIVAKVGPVHAGFGKSLIKDSDRLRDLRSLVSMHNQYTTTERFIDAEYELRLQKIGYKYRAMKKQLLSYWKTNAMGTATIEDVELTTTHKLWLDECSKMFGGMDIFALDVLHCKDGKEYILELNGTSIGFGPDHHEEDLMAIREVVVEKIKERLLKNKSTNEEYKAPDIKQVEVDNINMKNDLDQKEKDIKDLKIKMEIMQNKIKHLNTTLEQVKVNQKKNAKKGKGGGGFLSVFGIGGKGKSKGKK